ncbi:MAG: hypothetical protein MJE77_31330 [Proteobacteria bacterium]|nr:hypothetical protein [Pseudomonadota bacterium]
MKSDVLTPLQFDLAIAHADVDGIEIGVLGDGMPYLTERGLARASGQNMRTIRRLTGDSAGGSENSRSRRIAVLAAAYGHREDILYRDVLIRGERTRVYPDGVCMAILEYFAFEAGGRTAHIAQQSFRLLARQSLRHFIYSRVGCDDYSLFSDSWQYLHDRMLLNPIPSDHFSVYREITQLLVATIQVGMTVGVSAAPDISVGLRWGKYWTDNGLDATYSARRKHPHRFPASVAGPDRVDVWIYPIAALAEFRAWLRHDYVPNHLPHYLGRKTDDGSLMPSRAEHLLAAVNDNSSASA